VHTDEYEISLSRELAVCEGYVRSARAVLERMETRHGMTTDAFLGRCRTGECAAEGEFGEWQQAHGSLLRWSAARDEYRGLLDAMRQSATR